MPDPLFYKVDLNTGGERFLQTHRKAQPQREVTDRVPLPGSLGLFHGPYIDLPGTKVGHREESRCRFAQAKGDVGVIERNAGEPHIMCELDIRPVEHAKVARI